MTISTTEMKWSEFLAEGVKRFGPDRDQWRFQCPACGHVQSMADHMSRHSGVQRQEVSGWIFLNCEGRYDKKVGCNWSLGGLLHIHERLLVETGTEAGSCPVFLFEGEVALSKPFYTPREKPATKDHPHDR
jgi:hypothetical protein